MDRALVLRYQGIGFESQLARALKERQCTLKGQARYVNVRGSVHCKGVCRVGDRDLGVQNFFNWFLKLTNQRRPKVTCLVRQYDQSQTTHGKIVSEGKLPSTAK